MDSPEKSVLGTIQFISLIFCGFSQTERDKNKEKCRLCFYRKVFSYMFLFRFMTEGTETKTNWKKGSKTKNCFFFPSSKYLKQKRTVTLYFIYVLKTYANNCAASSQIEHTRIKWSRDFKSSRFIHAFLFCFMCHFKFKYGVFLITASKASKQFRKTGNSK